MMRRFGLAAGLVLAAVMISVAVTLIGLRMIEPQFTAVIVVAPTARSGAASVGARLPDSRRETAVSVAEPGAADEVLSDFSRYLALLRSLPVAQYLAADPTLLPRLFAERWDADTQAWRVAQGTWAGIKQAVLAAAGRTSPTVPDAVELAAYLARRVEIATVGTGPIRRISFRYHDRQFAMEFLQRLSAAADGRLRQEARRRAQIQAGLAGQMIRDNRADDHQLALRGLWLEEERLLMVLEADLPYAADILEPVHAAALPDWPNPLLLVAVSGGSALVLTAAAIGWRRFGYGSAAVSL